MRRFMSRAATIACGLAVWVAITTTAAAAAATDADTDAAADAAADTDDEKAAHQLANELKETVMGWPGKVYEQTPGTAGGLRTLTQLVNEEGRGHNPPRSGHEIKFYTKLKEYLRTRGPGQKLDPGQLLRMGMEAAADGNGDVNLADVYLTVHNVVRLLARPTQWSSDTSLDSMKDDPVHPILLDIQGRKSIDGHKSLADLRGSRRAPQDLPRSGIRKGEITDRNYTKDNLFDISPDGDGLFAPLRGVNDALGNGGAYYYFWLGTFTQTLGGDLAIKGGDWYEWAQKKGGLQYIPLPWARNEIDFERGKMQLGHFRGGGILADRLRYAAGFKNLAAGGYVFFRRRYLSRYCTNRPNIWAPLPLPQNLRRGDVPRVDVPGFEKMSTRLLDHWRERGLETANLRQFADGLFAQIRSVRGDQEEAKAVALSWWMGTLATRDRNHIATGLEAWRRRHGDLNPALRAVAERAIADTRR